MPGEKPAFIHPPAIEPRAGYITQAEVDEVNALNAASFRDQLRAEAIQERIWVLEKDRDDAMDSARVKRRAAVEILLGHSETIGH